MTLSGFREESLSDLRGDAQDWPWDIWYARSTTELWPSIQLQIIGSLSLRPPLCLHWLAVSPQCIRQRHSHRLLPDSLNWMCWKIKLMQSMCSNSELLLYFVGEKQGLESGLELSSNLTIGEGSFKSNRGVPGDVVLGTLLFPSASASKANGQGWWEFESRNIWRVAMIPT